MTRSEINKRWRQRHPEKAKAAVESWRVRNKEKRNEYARNWHRKQREEDPEGHAAKVRKHVLKRRYGITPEDYDTLLASQGGVCALCGRTEAEERYKRLHVDHCHETGSIRGLLCSMCNTALGRFGDTVEGLQRVLAYLQKPVISIAKILTENGDKNV